MLSTEIRTGWIKHFAFKLFERLSDKCEERLSGGDGVSPSLLLPPPPPPPCRKRPVHLPTSVWQQIKSSLFYRRGLIELAGSPSLARSRSLSLLKITYFLFISCCCSRPPIHLHPFIPPSLPFPLFFPPCKVRRGFGPTSN